MLTEEDGVGTSNLGQLSSCELGFRVLCEEFEEVEVNAGLGSRQRQML